MDALLTDGTLADFRPLRLSTTKGGPSSAQGKKKWLQNVKMDECRSEEKILPGERRADYEALWRQWLGQYEPETEGDLAQLAQVVDNAWRLRRAERLYTEVERALRCESLNPAEWPPQLLQRLQIMQGYRTSAESGFHKALRTLEFVKARRDAEQRHYERKAEAKQAERARQLAHATPAQAEAMRTYDAEWAAYLEAKAQPSRAQQLFQGQNAIAEHTNAIRLHQRAEIRITDNRTVTELFPSNEQLIEQGKSMLRPPEFVYRQLNFPDGIPAEYEWAGVQDPEQRKQGGSGIQRMTVDTWLELVDRESTTGNGHLLPAPNLPQAKKHGGCECPVCMKTAEILRTTL